ncbi:hypothetical protein [Gillisia hiemivivida]|uniref:Uncharacterized protein n=1 Tax=Gillisia hiemivivida TaxID=291190 RepID=A0A5C6ZN49_9FLAO|nr:hypothetical protein [Gillisia hiemivivida]TXD91970.1 hypothetical protein ES724_15315 [Gillisia hiemivivida]
MFIECISKEDGSKYFFRIDKKSYGIKKYISQSRSGTNKKEITFKEIEGKYYLDYSKLDFVSSYSPTEITTTEAVYNIVDTNNFDSKLYKHTNINVEPIKRYGQDWSDTFWEDYNYLPIPAWTEDLMKEENAK